ncbi:MAG: hypothetical protein SFW67_34705 [Myxococcaceae bacterium]|nr:hypothetical protein [Myxococcaceae bacterium]
MATVRRTTPRSPPARKPPPTSRSPSPGSKNVSGKPANPSKAPSKTGTRPPTTAVRPLGTRFQDRLAKDLDAKTRSTLNQPPKSSSRVEQKLTRRSEEKVTAVLTERLTARLSNPTAPRSQSRKGPLEMAQAAGERVKNAADVGGDVLDAAKGANAAVKKLLDLELAKKVPPAVKAAVGRIETKSAALQQLVDRLAKSGRPPTASQAARIASLQRDISANARSVANAGPEALATLGSAEVYQRAQAGLKQVLDRPNVARTLKGVEVLGKAADFAEAAKTAYDTYHNSVFSSRTGRAIDAGLTGAVNLGANTAFGVPDLLLTVAGVDEKNRIASTVTQASRALTSFTQALASGDTAALQRYRQQVQDGPVLLQELDGIGQRLADTRVLDVGFSYLDSLIGSITGNQDQVRRARALRGGG